MKEFVNPVLISRMQDLAFTRRYHFRLSLLLGTLSAYAIAVLAFRMAWTGKLTYIFLLWNLFLAWVPYGLSLLVVNRKALAGWLVLPVLGAWLLFLPNAPYILTDLVHLKARHGVPFWFDLMLILSFAFTGLLLGWISLLNVQQRAMQWIRPAYTWLLVAATSLACGFGIYLGRVLRYNSWDILSDPRGLLEDVAAPLLHPRAHAGTIGTTLAFAGFLFLGYVVLHFVMTARHQAGRAERVD
jgi:uncharacterized membrane protein